MDYIKIGEFITSERKAKNLTQAKLAEKLFVSEKTLSKWENGNGVPDTDTLPKLCEIFNVTINELLNGERLPEEEYKSNAENNLLELQKIKEDYAKLLLKFEVVVGLVSSIFLLSLVSITSLLDMPGWLKIVIIAASTVLFLIICLVLIKIEQVAGYYECKHCKHKHTPTYLQANFAPHIGRTKYLKCPNCGKKSWQQKVIK